jgi:hypothetical protein
MPNVQLITIKAGQHSVVLVPRSTTDLPFFYHTKQKTRLNQNIDYKGVDILGRPIRWKVIPNKDSEIGAPAIDAHEVWMRLVKPSFDERLDESVDVIPLGKIRECLRAVDWGQGGWEARRLLKALHQISAASCIADLWIQTTEQDSDGNPVFKRVNATFSKLTIYAIGATHITEEQLKNGNFNFDFDLEDTLYVQLHPVEAEIQKSQPQKYIDNQYLFSVKPSSRRWYELVAGKIFGVVKNKGEFCEIRYSWYLQHHHTLKRHHARFRVVEQMSEIIKDHLALGYISKVEYRKIQEPDQELDFIIRYYPGEAAKESIARIQGHIYRNRKASKSLPETPNAQARVNEPVEQGSRVLEANMALPTLSTEQDNQLIQELIVNFQITAIRAMNLVQHHRTAVAEQIAAFPHRTINPKNKAGWMIEAIEKNYTLPDEYLQAKQKEADLKRLLEQQAERDACSLCDASGYRRVKSGKYPSGAMKKCTHDTNLEAKYETA